LIRAFKGDHSPAKALSFGEGRHHAAGWLKNWKAGPPAFVKPLWQDNRDPAFKKAIPIFIHHAPKPASPERPKARSQRPAGIKRPHREKYTKNVFVADKESILPIHPVPLIITPPDLPARKRINKRDTDGIASHFSLHGGVPDGLIEGSLI